MQDNIKKLFRKEMTRKNFLHLTAIGIIGILGFGGVISFLLAHASSPDVSAEAEDGTLNSDATIGSDTNASGGQFVKFGSGGSVPGAPTAVEATAGNASASLTWTAPSSNGGSAITSYTITPYLNGTAQAPIPTGSTLTSSTVSSLTNGDSYTFKVAATNIHGTGSASSQSSAVTPTSGSGSPVPMMAGNNPVGTPFSEMTLQTSGDFEFANMASASNRAPTGWAQGYEYQGGTSAGTTTNCSVVNGVGIKLTQANSGSGVCLVTDPNYASPGYTCQMPFYREVEFIAPTNGTNNVDHFGSWLLSPSSGFECEVDMCESLNAFGEGSMTCTIHTGPSSGNSSETQNLGVLGLNGTSDKVGAYVSTSGVQFYLNGTKVGNLVSWPSSNPPTGTTMYGLHQADDSPSYGAVSDVPAVYTVVYDRFFV